MRRLLIEGSLSVVLLSIVASEASTQDTTAICRQLTAETACAASTSAPDDPEPLRALLRQLSDQRCTVVGLKDWYASHAQVPFILFRICGVLTILLSVAVPYLGTLEGRWRSVVLPIVALCVAALTGINSFFQWQLEWSAFRTTELNRTLPANLLDSAE
jgi:Protein of unknown function (DUF4231)